MPDVAPADSPAAPADGPRVVAFGGGHGLAASLTALRRVTPHLTAVVTVADDGGSSGRLRSELGVQPPGDLRMALSALAGTDEWSSTWCELFQHRFPGDGPLGGHAVGNLVITALTDCLGSSVAALDLSARLLSAAGRVLPLSVEQVDIVAEVAGLGPSGATRDVRGQVAVATTRGRVVRVRLEPPAPAACPEALDAVARADGLVLGPGSWFTSVVPHLLVPRLAEAVATAAAVRVLVLNLVEQPGETEGYSPEAHLEAFAQHAPGLAVDVVLADPAAVPSPRGLAAAASGLGAQLVLRPVGVPGEPRHDPVRLAEALRELLPAPRAGSEPAAPPAGTGKNTPPPRTATTKGRTA